MSTDLVSDDAIDNSLDEYLKQVTARCPFCEMPPPPKGDMGLSTNSFNGEWFVYCVGCFAQGPDMESPETAVQVWNERREWYRRLRREYP
jgi:hypothetical protein